MDIKIIGEYSKSSSSGGATEPTQLLTTDWSISVTSLDIDQTGLNTATLTAVITARPSGVTRYTVWSSPGSTPPTDPTTMPDVADLAMSASGNTSLSWVVPRADSITDYQVCVTASSDVFATFPYSGV